MTIDEFWDHVEQARRPDPEAHDEALTDRLAELTPDEILDFAHWWDECISESYLWSLWGAAELINGGCSDDGFRYFRDWLILQGREVFRAAVADPDSLADVVDPVAQEAEWECYPGMTAWFRATGTSQDAAGYAAYDAALAARHEGPRSSPELVVDSSHDAPADFRRLYPRLWAILG